MGNLATILDKKVCSGGAGSANTGKLGCLSLFGTPTHFLLLRKGHIIPKETTFNIAYISPLVQKGTIIPIIDSATFEDVSGEDTYTTNSSGQKRLNLQGLPEYKFNFEEGHEFYRELSKLKSFKQYDVIIGDDEGNWMMAKNSAGDAVGFSLGHVTPEARSSKVKGGESESKSVLMQFLDRNQFDKNYGIAHVEELDFAPQDIPLVNGVNLAFNAIPVAAGTSIVIKATLSSDNNTPVAGLLAANFVYKVDGATIAKTVVETPDGTYTFTVPALVANKVVSFDLWDGTLNVDVTKDAGGLLYRSDVVSETVLV